MQLILTAQGGATSLMATCLHGNIVIVKMLLAHGAIVDYCDEVIIVRVSYRIFGWGGKKYRQYMCGHA